MEKFYGTGVAMVTPFKADKTVDYDGLKTLINYLIANGVNYLVALGTTGETSTLKADEKKKIWEFTAEINNNRLPLVAGIGGNDTLATANNIKTFEINGYSAILSASPYYNKPTQKGIYEHYKALSEASELPILLYNVPGRTGSNICANTTCKLATDFKNIIGTKEASGNFEQFNLIMKDKPKDFLLISGDDPIALPMIALGAVGVISVIGNAVPKQLTTMINLCLQGKFNEALNPHLSLLEFTRLMFVEGNPAGAKAALKYLNICEDDLRLPLVKVPDAVYQEIVAATKKLGASVADDTTDND